MVSHAAFTPRMSAPVVCFSMYTIRSICHTQHNNARESKWICVVCTVGVYACIDVHKYCTRENMSPLFCRVICCLHVDAIMWQHVCVWNIPTYMLCMYVACIHDIDNRSSRCVFVLPQQTNNKTVCCVECVLCKLKFLIENEMSSNVLARKTSNICKCIHMLCNW